MLAIPTTGTSSANGVTVAARVVAQEPAPERERKQRSRIRKERYGGNRPPGGMRQDAEDGRRSLDHQGQREQRRWRHEAAHTTRASMLMRRPSWR